MKRTKYAVLFLLTVVACSKKNEDPAPAATRVQMLSAKKWQLRSSTIEAPGQQLVDIYAQLGSCSRDDFEQFSLPNTFIYDEGLTRCSPADPQKQVGVWALTNNDTELTITAAGSSETFQIAELTETSLKVSTTQPQGNGINAVVKESFVAID
ncbi:MAG: hypothetical protein M3Y54_06760 [Bacteroidota bacterium]|nr:hypothetical protein [Bacteroidota bacterium]